MDVKHNNFPILTSLGYEVLSGRQVFYEMNDLDNFTNGLLLELNQLRIKNDQPIRTLLNWCLCLIGRNAEIGNVKKMSKSIETVKGKYERMRRSKNKDDKIRLQDFLLDKFSLYPNKSNPVSNDPLSRIESAMKKVTIKTEKTINENRILKRKQYEQTKIVSCMTDKVKRLAIETDLIKQRKSNKYLMLTTILHSEKKENEYLRKRNTFYQNQISTLKLINRMERKRLNEKIKYWENVAFKARIEKQQIKDDIKLKERAVNDQIQHLETELQAKHEDVRNLTTERDNLLQSLENDKKLLTIPAANGRYTFSPQTDLCIIKLLDCHIAFDNVGAVIESVMEMCDLKSEDGHYPQKDYVASVNKQKLALGQIHTAEMCKEAPNQTLYTDETRKYGQSFGSFITTDDNRNPYLLGLRQMSSKASKTQLETLKEIICDIDNRIQSYGNNETSSIQSKLLMNMKFTMSDRAATEHSFNNLLQTYRESLLPEKIENFNELEDEEKQIVSRMYNFFCGLHLTVNIADVVNKVFLLEQPQEHDSFTPQNESAVLHAVRSASKAFAHGSDEKNGCSLEFRTYLNRQKVKVNEIKPFHGNRFKIAFHNGGAVFHYRTHIIDFLEKIKSEGNINKLNELLKSVLKDLNKKHVIVGCRALGLFNKFVTTPLLKVLEDPTTHILDMNVFYDNLVEYLQLVSTDTEKVKQLLTGEYVPFPAIQVKKDDTWASLVTGSERDSDCAAILMKLSAAVCKMLKEKVKDHLPQGLLMDIDENKKSEFNSVIPHNKLPERVFGYFDWLLHHRPNATHIANEAHLIFHVNKTKEWLDTKSEEDQEKLIKWSKKQVRDIKTLEGKRLKELEDELKRISIEKEAKANALIEKKLKEKEKLTKDIVKYGFWDSRVKIGKGLKKIKKKGDKREALKAQLKFRQLVLGQVAEKRLFQTSRINKQTVIIDAMKRNLAKLIKHAEKEDSRIEE